MLAVGCLETSESNDGHLESHMGHQTILEITGHHSRVRLQVSAGLISRKIDSSVTVLSVNTATAQAGCLQRQTSNKEIPGQLYPYNFNSPSLKQWFGPVVTLRSGVFRFFTGSLYCL